MLTLEKIESFIVTKTPVAYFIRRSKNWYLPGFEGVSVHKVVEFILKRVETVGISERASAVAYNFIMALPPSFLFLFTLIPNLPFISKASMKLQLHAMIIDVVPLQQHNINLIRFVDSFIDGSKIGLISVGFITALFFASNAMMGLMQSFNKNHLGFLKRNGFQDRWIAIKLTLLLFVVVLSSLILMVMQGVVLKWLGIESLFIQNVILYVRWLLIVVMIFYSMSSIYKYAPSLKKRWNLITPGSILATFLSIMATVGFSFFVNNFGKYNALYGSIGTIIVLMALIYINSYVLLIGFELNVSIKTMQATGGILPEEVLTE